MTSAVDLANDLNDYAAKNPGGFDPLVFIEQYPNSRAYLSSIDWQSEGGAALGEIMATDYLFFDRYSHAANLVRSYDPANQSTFFLQAKEYIATGMTVAKRDEERAAASEAKAEYVMNELNDVLFRPTEPMNFRNYLGYGPQDGLPNLGPEFLRSVASYDRMQSGSGEPSLTHALQQMNAGDMARLVQRINEGAFPNHLDARHVIATAFNGQDIQAVLNSSTRSNGTNPHQELARSIKNERTLNAINELPPGNAKDLLTAVFERARNISIVDDNGAFQNLGGYGGQRTNGSVDAGHPLVSLFGSDGGNGRNGRLGTTIGQWASNASDADRQTLNDFMSRSDIQNSVLGVYLLGVQNGNLSTVWMDNGNSPAAPSGTSIREAMQIGTNAYAANQSQADLRANGYAYYDDGSNKSWVDLSAAIKYVANGGTDFDTLAELVGGDVARGRKMLQSASAYVFWDTIAAATGQDSQLIRQTFMGSASVDQSQTVAMASANPYAAALLAADFQAPSGIQLSNSDYSREPTQRDQAVKSPIVLG